MDWNEFHLLRPLWLAALLPLGLLLWLRLRRGPHSGDWTRVIDAHLLPRLLVNAGGDSTRSPFYLLGLGWILAVLALAGPTWSKLPQPVYRLQTAQVLVMDLSRSMDAADLQPSRLARAKFKVLDLLARRREGQTALIVFAGEPNVVSPLTEDTATIAALVPALTTDLVPVQGSRTDLALAEAGKLLEQAGVARGDVLLITDGLDAPDAALEAAQALHAAGRRVSVLAVGTREGAPVPTGHGGFLSDRDGAIVLPQLDDALLRRLADTGGGVYLQSTADDRDLDALTAALPATQTAERSQEEERTADRWREQGPWLVLALLPLAALAFRRGWLAVILIMPLGAPPAEAFDWDDLWARPDQRGIQALEQGQAATAAELFEDPDWLGSAYYRDGRFEQAAQAYAQSSSAEAHYNRGNALARAAQLEEALAAYQEALALDPGLEDARFNHDLIEQLLQPRQDASNPSTDSPENGERDAQQKDGQPSPQAEDAAEPSDASNDEPSDDERSDGQARQQTPGQTQGSPSERESQNETDQTPQASGSQEARTAKDDRLEPSAAGAAEERLPEHQPEQMGAAQPTPSEGNEPGNPSAQGTSEEDEQAAESRQALEQWLRRIPDDPGGLLREKFRRQHLRRGTDSEPVTNPW